jgi:hypothetical protein
MSLKLEAKLRVNICDVVWESVDETVNWHGIQGIEKTCYLGYVSCSTIRREIPKDELPVFAASRDYSSVFQCKQTENWPLVSVAKRFLNNI